MPVPGGEMTGYLRIQPRGSGSHVEVHQLVDTPAQAVFMEGAWGMVLGRLKAGVTRASNPAERHAKVVGQGGHRGQEPRRGRADPAGAEEGLGEYRGDVMIGPAEQRGHGVQVVPRHPDHVRQPARNSVALPWYAPSNTSSRRRPVARTAILAASSAEVRSLRPQRGVVAVPRVHPGAVGQPVEQALGHVGEQ